MAKNKKDKHKHNLLVRAEERKLIKLVDATRVNQAEEEIQLLHNGGFFIIAVGEPTDGKRYKWSQWAYKKNDIDNVFLQNVLGYEYNTYLSMNSFKSPLKTLSNLYSLNALWADIDYYNEEKYKDKTYMEVIQIVSENKLLKKAPPSFFVYSGRGFYPIWLIEDAHAGACLPLWNKLMQVIHEEMKQYGADKSGTEASHVLRLAGSNNTKSNCKAKILKDDIIFNPRRYTLKELSDVLLGNLPHSKEEWAKIKKKKRKSKKDKRVCKIQSLFNIHSLNYARMQDIQQLIELREGNCKGTRELMLFLYRYWANCYHKCDETALNEILRLNSLFKEPLSESEVIGATKNAAEAAELWENKLNEYWALDKKPSVKKFFYEGKTGVYIYSNKKLIELLKITQEEMKSLRTMFNYEEKLRRRNEKRRLARLNENGLHSRQQAKWDKIYAILEFIEEGLTRKQMAERLSCSPDLVKHYMRVIRNENITKPVKEEIFEVPEFTRITDTELKLLIV